MSRWLPCKWRVFGARLRKLAFDGPYAGTRHEFVVCGQECMSLPSNAEYLVGQLRMLLAEVEAIIGRSISIDEWNQF